MTNNADIKAWGSVDLVEETSAHPLTNNQSQQEGCCVGKVLFSTLGMTDPMKNDFDGLCFTY